MMKIVTYEEMVELPVGADFGNWYRVYLTREEAESTPPEGRK